MLRLSLGATLVAAAFFANTAIAGHETIKVKSYDSLGKCVKAALSKKEGTIVKAEFKSEKKEAFTSLILNQQTAPLGMLNAMQNLAK